MKTRIFHTINAGLSVSSGETQILIDAIHLGGIYGFPLMPEELNRQLETQTGLFSKPDALLFTHQHKDHFDEERVKIVMGREPKPALWGPELPWPETGETEGQILSCCGLKDFRETATGWQFRIGDFTVFAYRTMHSGEMYRDKPHASLLLWNRAADEWIFVGGDALIDPSLAEVIASDRKTCYLDGGYPAEAVKKRVSAAVIIVFQMIEKPSREFLLKLDPERLLMYHHPDPDNDIYHYMSLIRRTLEKQPLPGHTVEQLDTMAWVPSGPAC